MKYLKRHPQSHIRVRLYSVFTEKIGMSFNWHNTKCTVYYYARTSLYGSAHCKYTTTVLLFCNESIIFNYYNFNLNLPNLSVLTIHVCSWIENKNKSCLIPILN